MKRFVLVASIIAALGLSSAALAAATLSGTYKTKLHTSALGGALNGTWTIKFKSGAYTVTDNGAVVVKGKYKIKGSKITLTDKTGKDVCPGSGTYKITKHGTKLKLKKISDTSACAGRVLVLTSHTLTKIA
jgi:hypothetical protein